MGSPARVGLAEPVHLGAEIGRVQVVESGERLEAGPRRLQVLDADEDVDDRLRVQARDRRAADVMDATGDPDTDRGLERRFARFRRGLPSASRR